MPDSPARLLACFAHERGDARVRKRIAALQARGWSVQGYMFHRLRDREDPLPFWENVELGVTENRHYLKRCFVIVGSLRILWQHRKRLGDVRVIYAVNTDNALLALAARWMGGRGRRRIGLRPPPLVLELADIQPAMLGTGLGSRVLRAFERWVLRRSALLVTTSPGFVREYFTPLQGYRGPVFLLENKVYPSAGLLPASAVEPGPVRDGKPWVIGLFGALRCRRSLEMMRTLAVRFPDRLHFYLRGYPSGADAASLAALLEGLPNLEWGGAYQYPGDLPDMYGRIDFNWTFDFSDAGANSVWLLPNRLYEGGLFACPALAGATTETGRWVTQHDAGWIFAEPLEAGLTSFFETLSTTNWQEKKASSRQLPRSLTCGEEDYAALSSALMKLAAAAMVGVPPSGGFPPE